MTNQEIEKYFFPKKLTKYNYNYYLPRLGVSEYLKSQKNLFFGDVLDLACGNMPYKDFITQETKVNKYIPMDIASEVIYENKKEITHWDGKTIPLKDSSVDTVVLTEFLEHVFNAEDVLKEVYRVLRPGGIVVGTVPFLWPIHEAPHDQYRYTPYSLKSIIINSNFDNVQIESLGGKNKFFALSIALWMEGKEHLLIKVLRFGILFIMRKLIKSDKKEDVFKNGAIFTGLGFIAKK